MGVKIDVGLQSTGRLDKFKAIRNEQGCQDGHPKYGEGHTGLEEIAFRYAMMHSRIGKSVQLLSYKDGQLHSLEAAIGHELAVMLNYAAVTLGHPDKTYTVDLEGYPELERAVGTAGQSLYVASCHWHNLLSQAYEAEVMAHENTNYSCGEPDKALIEECEFSADALLTGVVVMVIAWCQSHGVEVCGLMRDALHMAPIKSL